MSWKVRIHPNFSLNQHRYVHPKEWIKYAERLMNSSHEYEKQIGKFIFEWCLPSENIEITTSGSTGLPKSMPLQKKHMLSSAKATADFFSLYSGTRALLAMPAAFIAGKMMLVRGMTMGWNMTYIQPSQLPLKAKACYDFVAMTPYQVYHSLSDLNNANIILIGGGSIDPNLNEKLQHLKVKVFASYGMTETCSHIALRAVNGKKASSKFHAISGVKFSKDSRGCLIIDAPNVHDGVLITNDMIDLFSETAFVWKGRYDSVINSGGIKINPEQVEEKLSKYIDVNFFISSLPDPILGNKVILLIENSTPIETSLLSTAYENLKKYEVPKKVYYIERFAWTDTGKIQREKTLEQIKNKNL